MIRFKVPKKAAGERLDVFLASKLAVLSRASIKRLIDDKQVTVDKLPQKSGYRLHGGNNLSVNFDVSKLDEIPEISIPIIYEDDDCLVLNKPSGVLTHSKGAFNPEATVATFIRDKIQGMSGNRAGIVHRLDRGTSGVIICSKNEAAYDWLQKQFSTRKASKTYLAVVKGTPKPTAAVVDMPIERNPKHPQTFRVGANGRKAITTYNVELAAASNSLVKLKPETGRTHQLRVHLAYLGHPIVGDTFYKGPVAERLYLHAYKLTIALPDGARRTFTAPLPVEFSKMV